MGARVRARVCVCLCVCVCVVLWSTSVVHHSSCTKSNSNNDDNDGDDDDDDGDMKKSVHFYGSTGSFSPAIFHVAETVFISPLLPLKNSFPPTQPKPFSTGTITLTQKTTLIYFILSFLGSLATCY